MIGIRVLVEMRINLDKETIALHLTELSKKIADDYDTFAIASSQRIHSNGIITFPDGSLNKISTGGTSRAPQRKSSALTAISLQTKNIMTVTKVVPEGSILKIEACLKKDVLLMHGAPPSPNNTRTFLGIGIESSAEFTWANKQELVHYKNLCGTFTVRQTKSMSFSNETAVTPLLLVPIDEHYTIYLDESGVLRFLSHVGVTNIENQPLLDGVIDFAPSLVPNGNCVLATLAGNKQFKVCQYSRLHRQLPYNLIFHAPQNE